MSSVVRISSFVVLSLALHLLSLSFNFMRPAQVFEPSPIGIDYVSRPVASFYPAPTQKNSTHQITQKQLQQVKKRIPLSLERSSLKPVRTKEVEPASLVSKLKQKERLPEVIPVAIVESPSVAPREKPAPSHSSSVEKDALEGPLAGAETSVLEDDDPAPEVAVQLPVATFVDSEIQGEETAVLDPIKSEISGTNQDRTSLLPGQEEARVAQPSTNALPRYDLNPSPRYPQVAKLRGWEGKVVFEALILKSGRVGNLNLLASSGYRSLDSAARKAINRWQFKPAVASGVSVDSQVQIPITFSLKDL
ncbi:MAG: energy transducer TonB [Thermodesulfobacteriota bacterium]|nr:energy transducer TonB [Thermodesulfobacteriota bacterium]